jgi:hypothetical protein
VTASTAAPRTPHLPLGRALLAALAVVGVAALCAWGSGALDRERAPWVGLGAGVAIAVATATLFAIGRVFDRGASAALGADPKLQAMRLQGLLGLGFGAKLAVLAIGAVLMQAGGVKFPHIAAFAVAFVIASLLAQIAVTGCLLRDLSRGGEVRSSTNP